MIRTHLSLSSEDDIREKPSFRLESDSSEFAPELVPVDNGILQDTDSAAGELLGV